MLTASVLLDTAAQGFERRELPLGHVLEGHPEEGVEGHVLDLFLFQVFLLVGLKWCAMDTLTVLIMLAVEGVPFSEI